MSLQQWLVFLPAALLVAASPGANNFLAFANGMRCGLRPAMAALTGRLAAFAVMIVFVLVGLGAVLAASELAFTVIKWVGVAYLAWLGLRLWRSEPPPPAMHDVATSVRGLAMQEFWVGATNPKAILLFTAFLPQFVDPTGPWGAQFVLIGSTYLLVELGAAGAYALVGSRVRRHGLGARGARRVNRVSAAMMLAAAGWLATMRRGT